jgi:hypothetical protein
MTHPLSGPVLKAARRLKFPKLLALTAILFVVDFVVPDPIPFLDEILLGLATILFASWRESRAVPMSGPGDKE